MGSKFQYAAGSPGYGTRGNTGIAGSNGFSMYSSDLNGVTDIDTIKTKITLNETLMASSVSLGRDYQVNDSFIDAVGILYVITAIGAVPLYSEVGDLVSGINLFAERFNNTSTDSYNFARYSNYYDYTNGESRVLVDTIKTNSPVTHYNYPSVGIYGTSSQNVAFNHINHNSHSSETDFYRYNLWNSTDDFSIALVRNKSNNIWRFGNLNGTTPSSTTLIDSSLCLDFKWICPTGDIVFLNQCSSLGTIISKKLWGVGGYTTTGIYMKAGDASTNDTVAPNGDAMYIYGGAGSNMTGSTNGGNGGVFYLGSGRGGHSVDGIGGNGGKTDYWTGAGGDSSSNEGGIGGIFSIAAGRGGYSTSNIGGTGGSLSLSSGAGGNNLDNAETGGTGGNLSITSGNGGSGDAGGAGGDITIRGGTGGTYNTSIALSYGGDISINAGKGGTNGTDGQVGANLYLFGGHGGDGSSSGGNGGNVYIYSGRSSADEGDITISGYNVNILGEAFNIHGDEVDGVATPKDVSTGTSNVLIVTPLGLRTQSPWQNVGYYSGWAGTVQYRLDHMGYVHLKGNATITSASFALSPFYIPSVYYPVSSSYFSIVLARSSTYYSGVCIITNTGTILVAQAGYTAAAPNLSNGDTIHIDGITYAI